MYEFIEIGLVNIQTLVLRSNITLVRQESCSCLTWRWANRKGWFVIVLRWI